MSDHAVRQADGEVRADMAELAHAEYGDRFLALAESYSTTVFLLVAVLQKVGRVELDAGWLERADHHVVAQDPLDDGRCALKVLPRVDGAT